MEYVSSPTLFNCKSKTKIFLRSQSDLTAIRFPSIHQRKSTATSTLQINSSSKIPPQPFSANNSSSRLSPQVRRATPTIFRTATSYTAYNRSSATETIIHARISPDDDEKSSGSLHRRSTRAANEPGATHLQKLAPITGVSAAPFRLDASRQSSAKKKKQGEPRRVYQLVGMDLRAGAGLESGWVDGSLGGEDFSEI